MVADFKKNKSKNPYKAFFVKAGAVAIIILVVCLVIADIKVSRRRRELTIQIENLQNKVQELKNQNKTLQEGSVRAEEDTYIEKIAREELDLQQPGEKVISFVKPPGQEPVPTVAKNNFSAWVDGVWNSFVGAFKK